MKYKEFWITHDNGGYGTARPDKTDTHAAFNQTHVIEYSAYEELLKRIEKLKIEFKQELDSYGI